MSLRTVAAGHGVANSRRTAVQARTILYYHRWNIHTEHIMFYAFYVVAITILILHFTGWLKRNNLEWIVLVLAVATFPAVIYLR
jgi:hypothetical protein